MNDKQINKWLRRRFSQIGWILLAYYGLMNVLVLLTIGLDSVKQMLWAFVVGDFKSIFQQDTISGNAWGYILTIAVGFCILHAWKGRGYWKNEIFRKEAPITPAVLFCILSFCMGAQMINTLWVSGLELVLNQFDRSVLKLLESVSGQSDTISMFLYASILAPVAEEVLFRGYVLRSLRPFGKRFAILGSAILFGLFHGNLLQTPYAFLMGLVLGYLTLEYSIVWAIGVHVFNNLVLADLLSRVLMQLPELAASMINLLLFGGFAVVSVVILTQKRLEIWDYNQSEWIDRRCLKWFFLNSGILVLTLVMLVNMISLLFIP